MDSKPAVLPLRREVRQSRAMLIEQLRSIQSDLRPIAFQVFPASYFRHLHGSSAGYCIHFPTGHVELGGSRTFRVW